AIWIVNIPPKGKGFELALDSRMDTNRWLQVAGTVRHGRGLQWIEADAGTLTAAKAPTESAPEDTEAPVRVLAFPPPEVIFSAPTDGESDVSMGTNVRIQFSRDIDPATLKGHVRVTYLQSESTERGEPTTPTAEFTTNYNAAARVLELKF